MQLAEALGCNVRTLAKWLEEGMPVVRRGRGGRASLYDEVEVRAWLEAREEAARGEEGPLVLEHERALKEHWLALVNKQTYLTRERQLIPAAEVEVALSRERDAVRAKVLSIYTTRADRLHRIATLEGVAGVEEELRQIGHEVLRELAEPPEDEKPGEPRRRRRSKRKGDG